MTAEQRERVRAARDAAARERVRREKLIAAVDRRRGGLRLCAGCGGDWESFTVGCKACATRRRKRDPEVRAAYNRAARERRARVKAAA